MIKFTDPKLYVKGTCTVRLLDIETGDIFYASDKAQSGNITPSVNLNEIRAGLCNPIATMIPSDAGLQVNFTMADFNMAVKAAQLGATHTYSAPAPKCTSITATSTTLKLDITAGLPVAGLGMDKPIAYVQEVGAASLIAEDGVAYDVDVATGEIKEFAAEVGKTYKVTYMVQKVSAEVISISSAIDPKVARFEAELAVYANKNSAGNQGTRQGTLYLIVPCMKMQADAAVTGDQGTADTTIVSGQAVTYDPDVVPAGCSDEAVGLGYYVYVPDDDASNVKGLAVVGGVTTVTASSTAQLPVRFVMGDGSLVDPSDKTTGFTYTLTSAPSGTTISSSGLITAGATAGDCDCKTTYENGTTTLECVSTVSVVKA